MVSANNYLKHEIKKVKTKMKKNVIEEQSINDTNYQKLKELFPHAVSIDENGKYVIDPKKLQMSLDPSKADIREDGYGLNWVGKKEAYHSAFSKNYKVLKPLNDEANSKNWDTTENILIKGDNLDALKILRHNYFEAIKMIYIDPPYNTKNDGFVYNDNFTSSTEQTLEELGYDKEYIDYIENIQGAKTHSGWLSFMYPRLLLARDLLKDDGVIFISIDDNEVAQLRLLCDEVFGEDNFIGMFIVNSSPSAIDYGHIAKMHEYAFLYAKEISMTITNHIPDEDKKFKYNDEKGEFNIYPLYNGNVAFNPTTRPNLYYPFYLNPNKVLINDFYEISLEFQDTWIEVFPVVSQKDNIQRVWRWGKIKAQNGLNDEIVGYKTDSGEYRIVQKSRLTGKVIRSLLLEKEFQARRGTSELENLFKAKIFAFPKPIGLLQHFIYSGINENDIVLDFFAGSGTTAHAVMGLNAKDGGNRKFICVQWAEETPEKSEARKAGYETIFDITCERIKRAGDKILGEQTAKDGLLHSVRNDDGLDVGFRTFEVVEDTKQKIYQKSLEEMTQEDLLSFMSKPSIENNEEILYNLFVAENLPLSVKYEMLIENKLYLASNVAFVLGDINSDALVEALKCKKECEYITVYSPAISDDKFTLEIESNISKLGIKSDKLRFRG